MNCDAFARMAPLPWRRRESMLSALLLRMVVVDVHHPLSSEGSLEMQRQPSHIPHDMYANYPPQLHAPPSSRAVTTGVLVEALTGMLYIVHDTESSAAWQCKLSRSVRGSLELSLPAQVKCPERRTPRGFGDPG